MKCLAELRIARGLTQKGLSDELLKYGVKASPSTIALYETGKRAPSLKQARGFAKYFGVSTDEIEFGPKLDLTTEVSDVLCPTGTE